MNYKIVKNNDGVRLYSGVAVYTNDEIVELDSSKDAYTYLVDNGFSKEKALEAIQRFDKGFKAKKADKE